MSDNETTEEAPDEDFEGDAPDEDFEGDAPDEDFEGNGDDTPASDEDEDENEDETGPRATKAAVVDDEDDLDPDDVEADLDAILKERIAAGDDDDDDDGAIQTTPVAADSIEERQDTELHCPHCFLLVQTSAVAETGECGHCGGPIS